MASTDRQPGHASYDDRAPTCRVAGGFERVSSDAPEDTRYRVGAHRLTAPPRPPGPNRTFFTFQR